MHTCELTMHAIHVVENAAADIILINACCSVWEWCFFLFAFCWYKYSYIL